MGLFILAFVAVCCTKIAPEQCRRWEKMMDFQNEKMLSGGNRRREISFLFFLMSNRAALRERDTSDITCQAEILNFYIMATQKKDAGMCAGR